MCPNSYIRNLVFVALLPPLLIAGCQDYRWQWDFASPERLQATEREALEQGKLVFIFYKWYLDTDSNRMHGDVLADPEVGKLFQDTVNIALDKSSGPAYEQYLSKYGVTTTPACILVGPDGRYKVFTGFVPKERFVDLVTAAKSDLLEQTRRPTPTKVIP